MDRSKSDIRYNSLDDNIENRSREISVVTVECDPLQDVVDNAAQLIRHPSGKSAKLQSQLKIFNDDDVFELEQQVKIDGTPPATTTATEVIVKSGHRSNSSSNDANQTFLPALTFTHKRLLRINKCSLLEKILIFIIVFLILVLLTLIVHSNIDNHRMQQTRNNITDYCTTKQCLLVAGTIYKSLNTKIDPCDDFYEYSCGNWIAKTLIPSGFPRWGTLSSITYSNQLILKEQLEQNHTLNEISEAEMKASLFYKSCIDKSHRIEELGAQPLLDLLGHFMYVNASTRRLHINVSFDDLINIIQIDYGLNALFDFTVLDDDKNSTFSDIEIVQGSLGLDRSLYLNSSIERNNKTLEIYRETVTNVLKLFYGENVVGIKEEVIEMIKLEKKLAEIMISTELLQNVELMYSREKLEDITRLHAPFLNWTRFTNRFLSQYGSKEVVTNDDTIIVMGVSYFHNLTVLLQEYKRDEKKEFTLKLFIVAHLIKFSLPFLSEKYRSQFDSIYEALTGTYNIERWQTCIQHTDNIYGLGYAVARTFVRKSAGNSKTLAQEMIESIKRSFKENFHNIRWMDEATGLLAADKVNSVEDLIGYPSFIMDDTLLNARYANLRIDEYDYFGNEFRLVQYALNFEIQMYRKNVNRAEWEMTASAVNAYYSPTRNQIVFPSGILQEPFFHPDYPMSINYGSIGSIMGHELTHGFDDSGREYDKHGVMKQWWLNQTIEMFKNASQCMIDQYSAFEINNEPINGHLTLGENIADNGGMRSSFNAYTQWVHNHGPEKPLPLLDLTHEQLFFVSFAQTWCAKNTDDSMHMSLSMDQHSPPRYRVIGTMSNSENFAKTFKCPVNSKMNPAKKCELW